MDELTKQTLRASEIRRMYFANCSPATFWRFRQKDKSFPSPFKLGGSLFWDTSEVAAWYLQKCEGGHNE